MSQTVNILDQVQLVQVDPARVKLLKPGQPFDANSLSASQLSALAEVLLPYLESISPPPSWTPDTPGGLVAELRFNEGSGTSLLDRSGNGNNGTVISGATWSSAGLYAGATTGGVDTSIPWSGIGTIIALVSPNTAPGATAAGTLFDAQSAGTKGSQFAFIGDLSNGQLWPRMYDTIAGTDKCTANFSVPTWPVAVSFTGIGSSTPKIYLNELEATVYTAQATSPRNGSLRIGANYFGQAGGVTFHYLLVYSGTLSAADVLAAKTYMMARVASRSIAPSGPTTINRPLMTVCGNSIMNGLDLSPVPTLLGRSIDVVKVAISGASPSVVRALFEQGVKPLHRSLSSINLFATMPTPNATDASVILSNANALGDSARVAGFKAILITAISADGFDTIKNAVNGLYDSNWTSHYDALCNLRIYPQISADNANASTTYFLDRLHPTTLSNSTYIVPEICTTAASLLPPIARFTPATSLIAPSASVSFTDASIGTVASRSWDFGDGGTSTTANPSHAFPATLGTYTVTLNVTGPKGSSSVTGSVDVSASAALLAMGPALWLSGGPGYSQISSGGAPTIGQTVATILDRSGNNRNWTRSNDATRPTLQQVGGKYCYRFDKTRGDYIESAAGIFDSLTAGAMVFVVEKVIDAGIVQGHWLFGPSNADDFLDFNGSVYESFGSTLRKGPYTVSATRLRSGPYLYSVKSISGEHTVTLDGSTELGTTATNTVAWPSVCKYGVSNGNQTGGRELYELFVLPAAQATTENVATVVAFFKGLYGIA